MDIQVIHILAMPGWFQFVVLVLLVLALAPFARFCFQLYGGGGREDFTKKEYGFMVTFLSLMFLVAVVRCVIVPTYFT